MKINKVTLSLLTGSVLLFGSCAKDEEAEKLSTPLGAITGSTAQKVAQIQAIAGGQTYSVQPLNQNLFSIGNLPASNYTLKVVPKPGFAAPDDIQVPVTAGLTTNVGEITLQRKANYSFKVDGVPVAREGVVEGMLSTTSNMEPLLEFRLLANPATFLFNAPNVIDFRVAPFYGTGTYNLLYPTNTRAIYWEDLHSGEWHSTGGTLHITSYDTENMLISGTFSFTSVANGGNPAITHTITEGTFTDVYIQH